ncbi:MAG TPA: PHP domain-containing protein [Myxococcales bacterium]|nr:PHP domain-containing protein [Myxococcales bacterium]
MLIDLHAHSHLSKGCELSPKAVLERAAQHGLDGVAFTETNTQDGCDELFEIGQSSKVKVFVGLELLTDKGQYLCFFPRPELAPEPVQMWGSNREKPWSAAECLPKVKSLGAAIVAARPYDRDFPNPAGDYVLTLQCLSAVEGYNPKVRQTANDLAVEAAESLRLPCVAGSDARTALDEVGRAATLFKRPVATQKELVDALLGGDYWAVAVGDIPRLTPAGRDSDRERERDRRGGGRDRDRDRGGRRGGRGGRPRR